MGIEEIGKYADINAVQELDGESIRFARKSMRIIAHWVQLHAKADPEIGDMFTKWDFDERYIRLKNKGYRIDLMKPNANTLRFSLIKGNLHVSTLHIDMPRGA